MDHVVYLDVAARGFEKLREGSKTMLIRGAEDRKMPYDIVFAKDVLYFINDDGEELVKAKATVERVLNSDEMTEEESKKLVYENMGSLNLSSVEENKWAGKRYLVLITVVDFEEIEPFKIDRSEYDNTGDWLPIQLISTVMV
jgi:hypothetical protein